MSTPEATVLVVDDEPSVALLCRRVLERADFAAEAVTDPRESIAHLQQKAIDLLLVDIRMPEIDGFELMSIARRHQPNIAVVIMTGFGTVETAIEALRQGADGLILKPFSETKELVRSVREALERSRQKQEVARLQALRPLFNITEALFAETNPDRLLDLILNAIRGHLRCDHAGFYRHNSGQDTLALIAQIGRPLPGERIDPDGGPLGRAAALGLLIAVNEEGPGEETLQSVVREHHLGSVLCAPAAFGEDPRSVLSAGRDPGAPFFSEADAEMFGILARQAGAALENARLYAELREYVRQVEESQQALIQAEKMAAVGRLMASIAHEINNPLQAVRNCLHLASREELTMEKRKEYLDLSESELNRLMKTMRRMLDFSRPSRLEREPAGVNVLIERVLQLLEKQLEEKDVVVHLDLTEDLPGVEVAPNQIQQVFFNLILNAMDAMPEGGEIYLESSYQNGTVQILVEDTGPGVPEGIRENIFEPFVSTRSHGTGLGLSVSYNILAAHEGSLELVTDRGKGACFRVALPVTEDV